MSSRSVHSRAEYAPGRFGDGGAQHRFDLGFCATSTPGQDGLYGRCRTLHGECEQVLFTDCDPLGSGEGIRLKAPLKSDE